MNVFPALAGAWFRLTLVAVLALAPAHATSLPPMMKSQRELVGTWLGGAIDEEYARLKVRPDGTGSLAIQWSAGGRADVYRISRISLSGRVVKFAMAPGKSQEPIVVSGEAIKGRVTLTVSLSNGFTKALVMYPESFVRARIQAVTNTP